MAGTMAGTETPRDNRVKTEETVVADHEVGLSEKPYRPARWQSNLTILSCVSSLPLLYRWAMLIDIVYVVYRQLQRWVPERAGQSNQCDFQEATREERVSV